MPGRVPRALLREPDEGSEEAEPQGEEEEHQVQCREAHLHHPVEEGEDVVVLPELEDPEDARETQDPEDHQNPAPIPLRGPLEPERQDGHEVDQAARGQDELHRRRERAVEHPGLEPDVVTGEERLEEVLVEELKRTL